MGFSLVVLLFLLLFQRTQSTVTIFLKLYRLSVEENTSICDPGINPSACDLYLKICLRGSTRSGSCDLYILTPRNAFPNQNKIIFGESIDYIENPISVQLVNFPASPQLRIEVYDADSTLFDTDDLLTSFELEDFIIPALPTVPSEDWINVNFSSSEKIPITTVSHNVESKANISVQFSIWARCPPSFYGAGCGIECSPRNSVDDGYYGCHFQSGQRICIPGWYGVRCDKRDLCEVEKPCGTMGTCENTPEGFRCICKPPFGGIYCDQLPDECPKDDNAQLNLPRCLNGAFCVILNHKNVPSSQHSEDSPLSHRCICQPGFTGVRCELDVDECIQAYNHSDVSDMDSRTREYNLPHCLTDDRLAHPCCDPQAQCVNTHGNYECICQPGWIGLHCEYPPTIWPTSYHLVVNKTARYIAGFRGELASSNNETGAAHSLTDLGGKPSIWTTAFLIQLVVFVVCLPVIVIYSVKLRRRKKTLNLISKNPQSTRTPVRYTRPAGLSGLPQIPTSTTAEIVISRMKSINPNLYSTFTSVHSPHVRTPFLAEDMTDYEELTYGVCSEETSSMYDQLEEDTKHGNISMMENTKEMKLISQRILPTVTPEAQQIPHLQFDETLPNVHLNVTHMEPQSLQPPGDYENNENPMEYRRTDEFF